MQIKLIGTGSIGAKQSSACTLINEEILIDMPNGIVKKLKQLNCDVSKIKAVLITHLHGDHFADIPFFLFDRFFYKPETYTKIYCPKGTEEKVKVLFDILFPGDYEKVNSGANIEFIEFEELKEDKIIEDTYVESKVVEHGNCKPAYGFIVNKGDKRIGFSGDSRLCESIEEIIQKSDISVLDMSFAEHGLDAHMGLSDVELLCNKYQDKKVISTHMHDYTREQAKLKNIKNLIVPDDGDIIEI